MLLFVCVHCYIPTATPHTLLLADASRGFGFVHMADEQSASTAKEVSEYLLRGLTMSSLLALYPPSCMHLQASPWHHTGYERESGGRPVANSAHSQ